MRGRKEEELASHLSAENGLGMTIRAWRRFHGFNVTELAVRSGFGENGRGYISRIEHGLIRHLGEERLDRIAAALQLQSVDLLLHRMPDASAEAHTKAPAHDLEDAIIGAKALLEGCAEQSFDCARIQLFLARLHRERAATALSTSQKYAALIEAQRCIERVLLVFAANTTPKSFQEATQLGQEIDKALEDIIINGCAALLKHCSPQSLDWARIQLLVANFYYERAMILQGSAARTALSEAQRCIQAAASIFTKRQAKRNLKDAELLHEKIQQAIKQAGDL